MKSNAPMFHRPEITGAGPSDENVRKTPNGLRGLTACTITMFAVAAVFVTQPVFPEIAATFGTGPIQARLSFSMASFLYAAAFLIIGPATDALNLPRMAATGLVLLGSAMLYSSYSSSFAGFAVAMGCCGFAAAWVPAAMFPYVSHIAPAERRGRYVGGVVAAATTGVLVGRIVIGELTGIVGWPSAFRLFALILFFLSAASLACLDAPPKAKTPENHRLWARYADALGLLKHKDILVLYLTGGLLFFGFIGSVTFLTYRLSGPPFGFSAREIGWISFAGITALISPFAGGLSKRTGTFQLILPGLITCIVALQLAGWFTSVFLTVSGLLMLFLGVYTCQPLIFLLVAGRIPASRIGVASSFYILSCIGGGSVSTVMLGPVWDRAGWAGITLACSLAMGLAFVLCLYAALKNTLRTPGPSNG